MRQTRIGFFVLLAVLGLAHPAWAQLKAVYVEGTAEYKASAGDTWKPVEEGMRFPADGYVRTGARSAVELLSPTKARFVMTSNTLARIRFDEKPEADRVVLRIGTVLTEVLMPGATLQVRTPSSNMGVRGTRFAVLANPRQGSQVAVEEGKVFALGRAPGSKQAEGELVRAGFLAENGLDGTLSSRPLAAGEGDDYGFAAFRTPASGRIDRAFSEYLDQQQALFDDFVAQDLADYQLFVLDELDRQWTYFLNDNKALADQLVQAPLSGR